jgi:hypothetical protein
MTQHEAGNDQPIYSDPRPSRAGWVVMLVAGIILMLGSFGPLIGGIALASVSPADQRQYLTTGTVNLSTSAFALTSPSGRVANPGSRYLPLVHVLVTAESRADQPIFVGIARTADVRGYLSNVHHTRVVSVNAYPVVVRYRDVPGSDTPAAPTDQDFWAQSSSGTGEQHIVWTLRPGAWTVVIMNADGSSAVDADVAVGANSPVFVPIAIGLIAIGGVLFIAGLLLIVFGAIGVGRRGPGAAGPGAEAGTAGTTSAGVASASDYGAARASGSAMRGHSAFAPSYPANLTATLSPNLSRGLWLVKWILAVPHWVILFFLWIAFLVTTIIAGFSILFTGRYPRGLFDFNVGVLRWSWRVAYYSYSVLGTDEYPPFTLQSTSYPADFTVEYPEHLNNGLVLVKWWLLAIPHLAIVAVFTGGWLGTNWFFGSWARQDNGTGASLLGILVLIAAVILLFTGRYQQALFDLVMGINRWIFRVLAYTSLMRDEYPPFRLDQGGHEVSRMP